MAAEHYKVVGWLTMNSPGGYATCLLPSWLLTGDTHGPVLLVMNEKDKSNRIVCPSRKGGGGVGSSNRGDYAVRKPGIDCCNRVLVCMHV
jgi:hypothetical protein